MRKTTLFRDGLLAGQPDSESGLRWFDSSSRSCLANYMSCCYALSMPRPKQAVWRDEERVRQAFASSKTMSEIILKLGLPTGSASFLNCKRAAEQYNLSLPEITGSQRTARARSANSTPLQEVLVVRSSYTNRQALKRKLIKADLLENLCVICHMGPEWNGKPLVLQLDHINGVGDDNRLENLRLLCPNCHSQTDTFGYRGKKN